jgi:hypothetical protein
MFHLWRVQRIALETVKTVGDGFAGGIHGRRRWQAVQDPRRHARTRGKERGTSHAVSTAETQAVNAQAGAKEMGELAIGFAERNIASSFAFAQKLLQAKDPRDVVALHTDYVNSQIAALTDQAKELSKRAAKMGSHDTQH